MSLHNLHKLAQAATGGAGGWWGPAGSGGAGGGGGGSSYVLIQQKIEEYDWLMRFLEQNPDIKERYEAHKTFEILNNDNLT